MSASSQSVQEFRFIEESHQYFLGERLIPSVTQILNEVGLVCYDHIPKPILEHKAEVGTAAHHACWYLDEGDLNWSSVDPEVEPYVRAWEKFRNETDFICDVDGIERRGVAQIDGFEYGYTFDRKGTFRCRKFILEIKCTTNVEISWGPQTAAYEQAEFARDGHRRSRLAVHLKPNGHYSLVPLNDTKDYQVFRWALGLVTWKRFKGKAAPNGNGNHFSR